MENEKIKYKLFAFHLGKVGMQEAVKHRFSRANKEYILIYEDEKKVHVKENCYHIIDKKETGYLSSSEKLWLLECNAKIIAEDFEKNSENILSSFERKLEALERELKKEKERIEQGTKADEE